MKFKGDLYSYQHKAAAFALKAKYSICALEQGLGKTATAISCAVQARASKVLIGCPAFLVSNWQDEIEKFSEGLDVTYASYAKLRNIFESKVKYDFIIFDEAHYLKNIKSQRTKFAYEIVDKSKPSYVMLLSGTPVKNSIPDIWSLLNLCSWHGHHQFDYLMSYFSFCRNFCHEKVSKFNGRTVRNFHGIRSEKVSELKSLIAPMYHRKRVDQVALDLPEMVEKYIRLSDKGAYDRCLKDAYEALEKDRATAAFMTEKTANALAKIDATIELAKSLDDQVVIFSDHVLPAQKIGEHFGVNAITGATNMETRAAMVRDFNAKRTKILVASIGALSVGVNLTCARYMIFNDFSWVATDMAQAKKRIHRIGQDRTCFYYYIFSSKMDEKIYRTIQAKANAAAAIES
jgi:SNF2 family DNA or RNA helicase